MSLQRQARKFREVFGQDCLPNISHYGFIKKQLWDMQVRLIEEEAAEFTEAAGECFADPEKRRQENGTAQRVVRPCLCLLSICCCI